MEEILKQILTQLDSMEDGQKQITKRLDSMESKISIIEQDMATKADIAKMDTKIDAMDNKIDVLATHQEENVIGLLSLTNCKIDSLTTNTATKEDIVGLDSKFEVLNSRLFHQEAELHRLKVVK